MTEGSVAASETGSASAAPSKQSPAPDLTSRAAPCIVYRVCPQKFTVDGFLALTWYARSSPFCHDVSTVGGIAANLGCNFYSESFFVFQNVQNEVSPPTHPPHPLELFFFFFLQCPWGFRVFQ